MKQFYLNLKTAPGTSQNPAAACASSRKSGFVFPPSVQGDLFNYLKPGQQETLRPILRVIKRSYQAVLCFRLIGFLEGDGTFVPTGNPVLDSLTGAIIDVCGLNPLNPASETRHHTFRAL